MKTSVKNKFLLLLVLSFSIGFNACENDDDNGNNPPPTQAETFSATINMEQMANNMAVELNTNNKPYSNANGQDFNISKLRYLISDITFNRDDNSSFTIEEYHLVDLADTSTLTFQPTTKVPKGNYSSISFTFGFDAEDNISGEYSDLNVDWGWPEMLGGGYHFMQLEGQYDSLGTTKLFATHMGTARNNMANPPVTAINHFTANPPNSAINVTADFSFDIVMNVEQWYEDPFEWDFNVWNTSIMMNYNAQRKLNENGPSVFSIMNN